VKPRPSLPGGPYLVVGLARSGVAAALALRARGEEVIGCDAGAPDNPRLAAASERLSRQGVEVHLDASGDDLAARARTLIKSPGVPRAAPAVQAGLARGMPVLGELELAWRLLSNEFVAVTGTNGKTTTSTARRDSGSPSPGTSAPPSRRW
jgi:UDP-N-acetylmuramoylalanine--D-glutamate ligase